MENSAQQSWLDEAVDIEEGWQDRWMRNAAPEMPEASETVPASDFRPTDPKPGTRVRFL